jgi:hypothetical protein
MQRMESLIALSLNWSPPLHPTQRPQFLVQDGSIIGKLIETEFEPVTRVMMSTGVDRIGATEQTWAKTHISCKKINISGIHAWKLVTGYSHR